MKACTATTNIKASKERIWEILTDAQGYLTWDSDVRKIDGRIAPGEQVVVRTKGNPKRSYPARVTEFVPGERMTWSGGLPMRLFTAVRTFTLVPKGDGSVDFTLREEFGGHLFPLLGLIFPDLTESFERFVAALKTKAERG